MPFLNPSTATASVAANTNLVTVSGLDLSTVTPGMTISFGSRNRVTGDQYIVAAVSPTGTSGGTLTTLDSVPTALTNAAFVIDTTGFLGTDATYVVTAYLALLNTLNTLFGPNTNLYSGSRQLAFDKTASTALSRLIYSTGGRTWADLVHRTLSYTPTGGAPVSTETLSVRAFLDGTTATDALLVDLTTGGCDVRKASTTMASAATVDLSSAPTAKVAITGNTTIVSFGAGKHLERLVHVVDGGGVLTHSATTLILPGGANITTRAGDCLHATSDGSGNWRVRDYQRGDGTPLVLPISTQRASFRNRIRNGSFAVNTRSLSGTVSRAAGVYGHDGFKGGSSGCTYTFARSAGVTTITGSAGTLVQVIEGALYLNEGGTYTLSWLGTAQARINGGTYAASPITVAGLSPDANATIEWDVSSGKTLALPQFEPGSLVTPFEYRDDELRRCQRYLCLIYASVRSYNSASSQTLEVPIYFPVTMYAAPTGTLAQAGQRSAGIGSVQVLNMNIYGCRFAVNANASGDIFALIDAWYFSAEL